MHNQLPPHHNPDDVLPPEIFDYSQYAFSEEERAESIESAPPALREILEEVSRIASTGIDTGPP